MGVITQKYIRKPLYVDAVRVTANNFDEIAAWCQGEILTDEQPGSGTTKKYIKVRVHNPKNPRQTKAFIGDWLLYTERGYKVYTNKAFRAAFDEVEDAEPQEAPEAPTRLGNVKLTPGEKDELAIKELDAPLSEDEEVAAQAEEETEEALEERRRQAAEISEEVREKVGDTPDETPLAASERPIPPKDYNSTRPSDVVAAVDDHTTPQGEPHEYVEATPQAIADVVNEQQPVEPVEEGLAVQSSPTSPPQNDRHTLPPEVAPKPEPVTEQPPEEAAAGKRVLSHKEQAQLGPDQVRELVRSGEVILAQDLATS